MVGPSRTEHERERDLEIIADLYSRGFTQAAIAGEIGCTQQQVSYDIKVLHERWRASGIRNLDAAKERELKRLDAVEQEAWEAWRLSQHEQVTTEAEATPGTNAGERKSRTKITKRSSYGDAALLNVIKDCIARRCKILGIDAPKEVRHTGKDGGPIAVQGEWDLKGLSVDDLRALDDILTRVGAPGEGPDGAG